MPGLITSSSFSKALYPGVSTWYGEAYNEHRVEFTDLFDMGTSERAFEEDVQSTGFGLPSVKDEGNAIAYDTAMQGFITRYQHVTYALGFVVTEEAFDDDLYDIVGKKGAKSLAFSMRQGKEIVASGVYNNGFDNTFTGGDGLELFSAAHLNYTGGTYANELTTAADLSESALEQACIDIMKLENDRGLKIAVMPETLHIPVDLVFEAERVLRSPYQVYSADNTLNALHSMGKFKKVVPNHYFTDTDAWFIRTNVPDGMKGYTRKAMRFAVDNDFDTENAKFKAQERFSFGWTDPKGVFGSPGA
jgi:hypothetical protein